MEAAAWKVEMLKALYGAAITGAALGMLLNILLGVFRIHENTFLCEYLLCLNY